MTRAKNQTGLFDSIVVDLFAGLGGASIGVANYVEPSRAVEVSA